MKYPQLVSGRTVSGIGGWLSTQLDSRGLDGRVYARLLLSLLHGPAQINIRELLEASEHSTGIVGKLARKRGRGLEEERLCLEAHCELWTSEQVKRYAAVECLKSASEQNSGIESLVDELCVKLREIENESSTESASAFLQDVPNSDNVLINSTPQDNDACSANPAELANKYYAAFPALSGLNDEEKSTHHHHPPSAETSVWLTNSVRTTSASALLTTTSPQTTQQYKKPASRRTRDQRNRRQRSRRCSENSNSNRMWKETDTDRKHQHTAKSKMDNGKKTKSRVRAAVGGGGGHPREQWDTAWEFGKEELLREYINNQCNNKDEGYDTPVKCVEKDLDEVCFNREWIIEYEQNSRNAQRPETAVDEINMAKFEAKFNESVEALWNDDKQTDCSIDELNLPVDFQDLLSSPSDRMFEDGVDAKLKNSALLSSGRTLKNSIWSENLNEDETDCMLSDKSFYPRVGAASDEYKHQLELVRSCWESSTSIGDMELKSIKNARNNDFSSMPWHSNFSAGDLGKSTAKWSDVLSQSFVSTPYRVLNHSKHSSSFREVVPKSSTPEWPAAVIMDSLRLAHNNKTSKMSSVYSNNYALENVKDSDKIEDDLLTSPKTHFRPIKDDGFADGTTFAISSAIDHVSYKLCEDGLLAIATDSQSKRYMVYRQSRTDQDAIGGGKKDEFIIKFCVKQTSKSCQTDDEMMFDVVRVSEDVVMRQLPQDDCCCCCDGKDCDVHLMKDGSADVDIFDEEIQQLGSRKWCTKCSPMTTNNNNNIWTTNWLPPSNKEDARPAHAETTANRKTASSSPKPVDPLLHIWSTDKKPCDLCDSNTTTTSDIHKLKSELRKDGEEILSDLSYMQSLYIGSEWEDDDDADPAEQTVAVNETPFDVNKLISNFIKPDDVLGLLMKSRRIQEPVEDHQRAVLPVSGGGKLDRKRRHSSTSRNHKDAPSGECKKPHCKFSHEITSMPCQFWADNSCQPDGLCPYQHQSAYARPLTR